MTQKRSERSEAETMLQRLAKGLPPRPMYWVLHADHAVEPLESGDALEWSRRFAEQDRRVAQNWWVLEMAGLDRVPIRVGIRVSTVFIGLDGNFWADGPALVFETMVFGGPRSGEVERYATWDEAVAGHARFVAREAVWLSRLRGSWATIWERGLAKRGKRAAGRHRSRLRLIASGHGDMAQPADEPRAEAGGA